MKNLSRVDVDQVASQFRTLRKPPGGSETTETTPKRETSRCKGGAMRFWHAYGSITKTVGPGKPGPTLAKPGRAAPINK